MDRRAPGCLALWVLGAAFGCVEQDRRSGLNDSTVSTEAEGMRRSPPQPVVSSGPVMDDPERCPECSIELSQGVVLDSGGEEFGGVGPGPLFRDSRGRFLHLNALVPSAVLRFDSDGTYLGGFERPGRGPGEFLDIRRIVVGQGDTLHLLDIDAGRLTTLTPELELVRSSRFAPRQADVIEVRPGLLMIRADLQSPERIGYPLHPFRNGELAPPIGGRQASVADDGFTGDIRRFMARESDSTFWAAHMIRYRFDLWRTDGTLLRVLAGNPDWFDVVDRGTLKGRINPVIRDLEIDGDGLLWVLVRVRSLNNWEEIAFEGPRVSLNFPNLQSRTGDLDDLVDSMILVIDPDTGVVLATRRFDYPFRSFAGRRRVYAYDEETGLPQVVVWRLHLSGAPPRLEE